MDLMTIHKKEAKEKPTDTPGEDCVNNRKI